MVVWLGRVEGGRLDSVGWPGGWGGSQEVEVAPLFVCQPRWDPLPILLSTPRSPFPLNYHPRTPLRTPCGCGIDARDRARTHTHTRTYARQRERARSVYTGVVVYVLHLTNITSMYSANAMCRGYIANTWRILYPFLTLVFGPLAAVRATRVGARFRMRA